MLLDDSTAVSLDFFTFNTLVIFPIQQEVKTYHKKVVFECLKKVTSSSDKCVIPLESLTSLL